MRQIAPVAVPVGLGAVVQSNMTFINGVVGASASGLPLVIGPGLFTALGKWGSPIARSM